MKRLTKVRTLLRLGVRNLVRVGWYRAGLKTGCSPAIRVRPVPIPSGAFFSSNWQREVPLFGVGELRWAAGHSAFGRRVNDSLSPPDWHRNVINGKRAIDATSPWWQLPDFDAQLGDIKGVWEASRFDWVVSFAALAASGDVAAAARLEEWLNDWVQTNPAYCGLNWKCGQEASIRVIHLAMALDLSGQAEVSGSLAALIQTHLKRISPTTSYAKAQDNNHGTSEAGGLFIGGLLLLKAGVSEGHLYIKQGRDLLEDRVNSLIARDGSFSQHSTNYHRLMLDTLSLCELWRRKGNLLPFSPAFYLRAQAATGWLHQMLDPITGDAPVLGANDGAELLVLHGADYRDHRPSVHLAANLFLSCSAFPQLASSTAIESSFDLQRYSAVCPNIEKSEWFRDGGYCLLRDAGVKVLFNYPRYRFRPIQSDALHVDLWGNAKNLLRDGGTYSYNAEAKLVDYFAGTASHNTIEFDGRDQMRKISRFLFADWLAVNRIEPLVSRRETGVAVGAGYQDFNGAAHHRTVSLKDKVLEVTDIVGGSFSRALLRWRLIDAKWKFNNGVLDSELMAIEIISSDKNFTLTLNSGRESRYYGVSSQLAELHCEVSSACTLTTRITIK